MSDANEGRRARPIGVFFALKTKDNQARKRDGHPYYAINAVGLDPRGNRLFEVCFGDGTWMLAVDADLQPTESNSLP